MECLLESMQWYRNIHISLKSTFVQVVYRSVDSDNKLKMYQVKCHKNWQQKHITVTSLYNTVGCNELIAILGIYQMFVETD